jgi:hypothetical protein
MITRIGSRTKADGSNSVGKLSVTINSAGQGVADLLSTAAVAAPTAFSNHADASSELQKADGIAVVTNRDSKWIIEDLNKSWVPLPSSPPAIGQFSPVPRARPRIKIADAAFASDPRSFVGGRATAWPASYLTILHEEGHAIAAQALRNFSAVTYQATAHPNTFVEPLNAVVVASNAAGDDLKALIQQYNDLVHAYTHGQRPGYDGRRQKRSGQSTTGIEHKEE